MGVPEQFDVKISTSNGIFGFSSSEWDKCMATDHMAERMCCAPWLAEFSILIAGVS